MFEYSLVSEDVQNRTKNLDFVNYVKVIYHDPDPVLKDYVPNPCIVTQRFKDIDRTIKEFPTRHDDVWVLGYYKTGTTLTAELITVLLNGTNFVKLEEKNVMERCPFMESFMERSLPFDFFGLTAANPNRRAMRTHLPMNLLPRALVNSTDPKMIYVARNPKDAAVSWYHHFKNVHGYEGSFNNLMDCYLRGENVYGSYFQHLDEYLRLAKVVKNLLIITYEDLVSDPVTVIRKVANFIGTPFTDEEVEKIADYIHFEKMKSRECSNLDNLIAALNEGKETDFKFCRKGKEGSHKTEMPPKYIEMFNEEMRKWPEIMELYVNF